jgi:hypothetical protein
VLELSEPYLDGATGKMVLSMVTPVFSKAYVAPGQSRQLLGAMLIDVSVTELIEKYQNLCSQQSTAAFGCKDGKKR